MISPLLLYALASAGWEDDISIVDSTFPAETIANDTCKDGKVIRQDGIPIVPLVREIMKLWQLDRKNPLAVMVNEENKVILSNKKLCYFLILGFYDYKLVGSFCYRGRGKNWTQDGSQESKVIEN